MCTPAKRVEPEIHVATIDDLDVIVELHNKYINYGESIYPHFYEVLSNPDSIAFKCCIDDEIAGINILVKGIELSGKQDALVEQLTKLANGRSTYSGDAIVVKPEYRKYGVATLLFSAGMHELRRRNVELVVAEGLVLPDGRMPFKRVMLQTHKNYISLGIIDGFYRDFYKFGYLCPVCGIPCKCSAEIFLCEVPQSDDCSSNPV